jgi:hypothetical protein
MKTGTKLTLLSKKRQQGGASVSDFALHMLSVAAEWRAAGMAPRGIPRPRKWRSGANVLSALSKPSIQDAANLLETPKTEAIEGTVS